MIKLFFYLLSFSSLLDPQLRLDAHLAGSLLLSPSLEQVNDEVPLLLNIVLLDTHTTKSEIVVYFLPFRLCC